MVGSVLRAPLLALLACAGMILLAGVDANAQVTCPCTIWSPSVTPANPAAQDSTPVEVGVKFRSSTPGYITAIRFYKGAQNVGPHVVNLWTVSGTLLTTVSVSNESASGWQQISLPDPIAIAANTTYVASYHTNSGFYADDQSYFASSGVVNGPLQALQDGADGSDGVYAIGVSAFPTNGYNSSNYWVDVVFQTSVPPDTTPPTVSNVSPSAGAAVVPATTTVTATFSEGINPSTITSSTFELLTPSNAPVGATLAYNSATRTATLSPSASLPAGTTYTARVAGGPSGVTDLSGNALATDFVWSFTTAPGPPASPTSAPGGPILVVTSTSNPFSVYYGEILRAEGMNEFAFIDINAVTSNVLAGYDIAILGDFPLTSSQVTTFTNWVNGGGALIAMHPDKQLAGLLGLAAVSSTLADAYLKVDTSSAPGLGIVAAAIQYHGSADVYTLAGASAVATLYSNASTSTPNPAVTLRQVGAGQVSAFTYDLARSIVYTRQGNPAWSGQARDGYPTRRSDDLFFGGSVPDYVDLSNVAIPQADEQQRLLANLIGLMNASRRPLPKFWYFPRGLKAVVVMTGDDHANGGTTGRFDTYIADSPAGCNVGNWECIRSTSYVYTNTPITPAQIASYQAEGFEIALHLWSSGNASGSTSSDMNCHDFTPASLTADLAQQLSAFASRYPGVANPRTNRTHCIVWSDYDTEPQVERAQGIRLDASYYYWPPEWVKDTPGLFTGSGMPMRFALRNGAITDVYQATSQMTDESGQSFPFTIDTLLSRALGPEGYYGAFTANMHTDYVASTGSDAIVASAKANGVPVISAGQLLDWLDARNSSFFSNITFSGNTLTFGVSTYGAATGLEGMVPANVNGLRLASMTQDGSSIPFAFQIVKGVEYAFFFATGGSSYAAVYQTDSRPLTISSPTVTLGPDAAQITWTSNKESDSRVDFATTPSAVGQSVVVSALTQTHNVELTGLLPGDTYFFRVTSTDVIGNSVTQPAAGANPAYFTISQSSVGCPCSLWSDSTVPVQASVSDTSSIEVGVKFQSTIAGYVTGIRFYKGPLNTGAHVGHLWNAAGTLLASVTFTNETASGWQTAMLSSEVALTAGQTYVVSYHTSAGGYAATTQYFTGNYTNGPLTADAAGNGVYAYGAGGFPTNTYNSDNYWVDVVFTDVAKDTTLPVIFGVAASTSTDPVSISWLTTKPATSRIDYGLSAAQLTSSVSVPGLVSSHVVTLTGLLPNTTYYYQLTSVDASGNVGVSSVATFTSPLRTTESIGDTTVADFSAGALGSNTYVSQTVDGELILAPAAGTEFFGTTVPAGWTATPEATGGSVTVGNGVAAVDGARVSLDALNAVPRRLDFSAMFSGDPYEHVGFGLTFNETPWMMFSTRAGGALYARSNDGTHETDTLLSGSLLNVMHAFRIDWTGTSATFYIDGTQVATHSVAISGALRPIALDYLVGGGTVTVDWMRMGPYATSGTFQSRVLDAGSVASWTNASWTSAVPTGGSISISVRFGNSATPDATWTSFVPLAGSGATLSQTARYVQYQVTLTSDGSSTPVLYDITFTCTRGS